MKKSSSLLVLLVALAAGIAAAAADQAPAAAAVDTVADTCNAIRNLVDYAFCTAALRSAGPGSDRHAHLLLAADQASSRAASAGAAASALARSGDLSDDARDGLEACAFLYGASSAPALRLLRGYAAARALERARSLLLLAAQGGIGCEAAFGKGKGAEEAKGKMAAANREFEQLNTLATALVNNQA
ncbi:uncharacterized protein LOC100822048 [Brachypodium distachyon]|uniref:Pectinesterase inhibitor domain-containing protein n=1 Tax=Brachypodium distachyon TaxID=15368 RepID=I1II50_BRADI|nr:uncharacterized protein LOC100822048 [Brachypodium distachyon]PNT62662.1 hypothetical protein BRADI_4g06600v3 [Brachypodium distachyon]|eukprot:XP_024311148.1 uncharacterized protein LOC100822048 [Brachypodium distachyon]